MRRGLALLGRAVRHEPRIFAIAVGGSAVYGIMTVGSAWVLGRVTDRVIEPAFRTGETTTGALAAAALAILGVALLKAAGIVGRRLGAASCSTACRRDTGARSPSSTSTCRCPGT